MKIRIPSEPSFNVPEGQYRAVLTKVVHLTDRNQVRLIFQILHPGRGNYVAGKNYDISLEKGSPLRNDLISWMNRDFTAEELQAGHLDLESKVGDEADLLLTHAKKRGYDQPFVFIAQIRPAGTLVKTSPEPFLQPLFV